MAQEIIKPLDTRSETMVVFTVSFVILIVALVAILLRREGEIERYMLPYQISAYSDLGSGVQAIYQDLYAAALEIDAVHDESGEGWPSIVELEEEYMAPFIRDRAWAERGRMRWTTFTFSHSGRHESDLCLITPASRPTWRTERLNTRQSTPPCGTGKLRTTATHSPHERLLKCGKIASRVSTTRTALGLRVLGSGIRSITYGR